MATWSFRMGMWSITPPVHLWRFWGSERLRTLLRFYSFRKWDPWGTQVCLTLNSTFPTSLPFHTPSFLDQEPPRKWTPSSLKHPSKNCKVLLCSLVPQAESNGHGGEGACLVSVAAAYNFCLKIHGIMQCPDGPALECKGMIYFPKQSGPGHCLIFIGKTSVRWQRDWLRSIPLWLGTRRNALIEKHFLLCLAARRREIWR